MRNDKKLDRSEIAVTICLCGNDAANPFVPDRPDAIFVRARSTCALSAFDKIGNLTNTMNLNQVTIPSHDLVTAVEFYEKLGLQLIVDSVPRYARFCCPTGDATFSIHHVEHPIQTDGLTVYFECDDLDDLCAKLEKKLVKFDIKPIDQRWLWREAHLRDPDGNRLILYYAGKNRKNPPWRIGASGDTER